MKRIAFFLYGAFSYLVFVGTFLYTAGFLVNLFVPQSVDGDVSAAPDHAIATNLLLLAFFAVQHSGMARPAFKRVWTQIVPEPIERATYVLSSSIALIALMTFWQPIEGTLWHFESGLPYFLGLGTFAFGIGLVVYSTMLIDPFEFFGLRQVLATLRKKPARDGDFVTPSLYRFVRHPLYVGWFITLWATPSMSVGHLLFAAFLTAYVLIAVRYEERDLVNAFGRAYARYQQSTPMFIPAPAQFRDASSRVDQETKRTITV